MTAGDEARKRGLTKPGQLQEHNPQEASQQGTGKETDNFSERLSL